MFCQVVQAIALSVHFLTEITFYEFLQVREIVAVLDLDVLFYPCPKNGPNFRPKVAQMGGKQQFPYMVRFFFFLICFPPHPHFQEGKEYIQLEWEIESEVREI